MWWPQFQQHNNRKNEVSWGVARYLWQNLILIKKFLSEKSWSAEIYLRHTNYKSTFFIILVLENIYSLSIHDWNQHWFCEVLWFMHVKFRWKKWNEGKFLWNIIRYFVYSFAFFVSPKSFSWHFLFFHKKKKNWIWKFN